MDRQVRSDTQQQTDRRDKREGYLFEGEGRLSQWMSTRTAAKEGSFFLPYLRPGMDLLDCGCGTGSITFGLAQAVDPGQATGIDVNEQILELARNTAREQGVKNVRYEMGSVYALPFDDASFDAVFAHSLIEHLSEPLDALAEMRRVLRPGGVVGIRTGDFDGFLLEPADPLLLRSDELRIRLQRHKGGDPFVGKHFRGMLHRAGFSRIRATASYDSFGDEEQTRRLSALLAGTYSEGPVFDQLLELGWADREELMEIAKAWRAWGDHPGAFNARSCCEAVAWKE